MVIMLARCDTPQMIGKRLEIPPIGLGDDSVHNV